MSVRFGGLAKTDPRLRQVIDRSIADFRSRDLAYLLRRVAVLAREIVGCGAATVTILDIDGRPEHVISIGTGEDGSPTGAAELAAGGFSHTELDPTRTRLTVPLSFRGRHGGGLQLSRPHEVDGFTVDDRHAAEVIATAIVDEVERARTALENRRRERWYTAGSELARSIASGRHDRPLTVVAEQVRVIADADRAAVLMHDPVDDTLTVRAIAGVHAEHSMGLVLPAANAISAQVLIVGTPLNVAESATSELIDDTLRRVLGRNALLIVPLLATRDRRGVIAVARGAGRKPFTAAETGMAMMLAGQVGLALELAEAQDHRDQNKLLQERDRIARDLHDHVIQRLFALGMALEQASLRLSGPQGEAIRDSVDEVDSTIRQIRTTIYQLRGPIVAERRSIRARTVGLVEELAAVLGFRPELDIRGPVDLGVNDPELADDCVAVLREALTNVARHAEATQATVVVSATPLALRIEVVDNGRGISGSTRRSGLANLRARAERHGGSSTVSSDGRQGTAVLWTVPLRDQRAP